MFIAFRRTYVESARHFLSCARPPLLRHIASMESVGIEIGIGIGIGTVIDKRAALCVAMLVINYVQICLPCIVAILLIPIFCFCMPCLIRLLAHLQNNRAAVVSMCLPITCDFGWHGIIYNIVFP